MKGNKEYRRFIKFVENLIQSDYCTELIGITQEQIVYGTFLDQTIDIFIQFKQGLYQLVAIKKGMAISKELQCYINIKQKQKFTVFIILKKFKKYKIVKDPNILDQCGLNLKQLHYSGIDDLKNIFRIIDK
ncbi:unnamed protein product [Paramecium sonneborni]|uniref:Uncharacterized protein n=1 Tax=Paramecium sonneborni TaxID=65129 RepID=A0A8S1LLT6_9CILI|nr:unnamed protein product [Paramecium sonneborni]